MNNGFNPIGALIAAAVLVAFLGVIVFVGGKMLTATLDLRCTVNVWSIGNFECHKSAKAPDFIIKW